MTLPLLPSCVCGKCRGCPDGWHHDDACDCTADCVLGDDDCPECGYSSVADGECRVCHTKVPQTP